MAAEAIEFRLLGPLEAVRGGEVLALGAPKQRALLAVLLLRVGEPVSVDVLAEAVWPERPQADPDASVQVYVSQLRRVLGRDSIVRKGPGYVLDVSPAQIDLGRFRELADEGRSALESEDARGAHRVLTDALALWRGPARAREPVVKADRLHPLVPRESKRWGDLYRGRASVERAFGRLKNERGLAPLRVRGLDRVQLHADLCILATLASALARARAVPLAA